jgi:Icc-related predicted phosphoesterase
MKILFVSDVPEKALWDYYQPSRVSDIDLIISCGDLPAEYLEFLVTMVNRPLLYVKGNHDSHYEDHPPQGCQCIDDKIVTVGGLHNGLLTRLRDDRHGTSSAGPRDERRGTSQLVAARGLRIMGLGGSMRYKPQDSPGNAPGCMYTEREMQRRIRHMRWQLRRHRGIDILVTHAPALGYGDMHDLPHRGFACFNDLLHGQSPRLMAFGHVHGEYGHFQRTRTHPSGTLLVNTWQSFIWDTESE